jgi:hypothetical protein
MLVTIDEQKIKKEELKIKLSRFRRGKKQPKVVQKELEFVEA